MAGRFIADVRNAVANGILKEPFDAKDVEQALTSMGCQYAQATYSNMLPKHRKGNPSQTTEYFERTSNGYILL